MADHEWSDEELAFFAVTSLESARACGRAVSSRPSATGRADMGQAAPAALGAFVAWAIERDLFLEWKAELGPKLGCTLELARAEAPVLLVAAEAGRAIGAVVRGPSDDLLEQPDEATVYLRLAPGTSALVRIGEAAVLAKQAPGGEVILQEVAVAAAPTAALAAYAASRAGAVPALLDETLALIAAPEPAKWLAAAGMIVRFTGAPDALPDAWPLAWVAALPAARLLEAVAAARHMVAELDARVGRIAHVLADDDATPEAFAAEVTRARVEQMVRLRDDLESVRVCLVGATYRQLDTPGRRAPARSNLPHALAALEARIAALDEVASPVLRSLPAATRPQLARFARGPGVGHGHGYQTDAWWITWRAPPQLDAGDA